MDLRILRTWDGVPVRPDEEATLRVSPGADGLAIAVDAVYHGDPAPLSPPGRTDRLWEHEVIELFLLGEGERYTEIELGPHGHFLVLRLASVRRVEDAAIDIPFSARIAGGRWTGDARVPWSILPVPVSRLNAYAIHGAPDRRRYLAWSPVPGPAPDFHRIHLFPGLPTPLRP
jgi:hypothetical protein